MKQKKMSVTRIISNADTALKTIKHVETSAYSQWTLSLSLARGKEVTKIEQTVRFSHSSMQLQKNVEQTHAEKEGAREDGRKYEI